MATTVGGVSADINSILNPAKAAGRSVTAELANGDVSSNVTSTGDTKIFEDANKKLGKQDFLQLLVTQLKYQDPLQPSDNEQFVAQLAQFSNLEGTQNINTSIEDLGKKISDLVSSQASSSTSISNASATNLIGKSVRVNAADVVFDPTKKDPIEINVHTDPGKTSVLSILDSEEKIVNALPLQFTGEGKIKWNGMKMDGSIAPGGSYKLKVTSPDGTVDTGYTYLEDKVSGISYSKTGMRLEVRGQSIGMDQVVHVGEAAEPAK
jgi:flagellar basal-body rod modification protein FlgD